MEGHGEGGIGLLCESKGWDLHPELIWLDHEENNLPAGPTETLRDSMGLYIVRRHLIVQDRDTKRVNCRVVQKQLKYVKETKFHITAEMFPHEPWKVALAVLFPALAFIVFVSIYCVKLHRKKGRGESSKYKKDDALTTLPAKVKSFLKKKYDCINEGLAEQGKHIFLNKIYTELYITEGGSGDVNKEHEVRQIETASKKPATQETAIKCNDIFKPLNGQEKCIRIVLTKGIAGIGKTVSVQKFILDWAEGKANQDVDFIFPLPFRELNLIDIKECSLMQLLHYFFPEVTEFRFIKIHCYKVVFIFDGLDECRLPLNFQTNKIWYDVTEPTSLDVLLTNLIKGNLLPSALLWITTRPAAANQIPPECVQQVTEVRGFNDPQKEEYFSKRFSDQNLASRIITHIKSSRSLYIMCHIPVFCWIVAIVLGKKMGESDSGEIPRTLTQMYTHFLLLQASLKKQKYPGKSETNSVIHRKNILKLGKLAFQQLKKGHLIFFEKDLRESGIDVTEASVYSGMCTELFRTEPEIQKQTVFSFVHLSVQEYLAALYVFLSYRNHNRNVLVHSIHGKFFRFIPHSKLAAMLKIAVDQALRSENGHLDLFLRFLLGLSLDSNQTLLHGLLTQTGNSSRSIEKTAQYIKEKISENLSPERTINLFHCLNELNDHSLVEEVQGYLSSGSLSNTYLSPAQWSALVFVLLTSEEELDVFDLKKYIRSDEGLLRLLPVVKASRAALLNRCNLSKECCETLASAISSNSSSLRELDLSDNELQDSGVELLSAGLGNPHCKLEKLRLSGCRVTERGCVSLASALHSNPSHLRELDLSYNHPGDSGVRALSAGLDDPNCKLEKLSVDHGGECRIKPGPRKYACQLTLDPNTAHRNLSLSEGDRKVTRERKEQPYPDHPERFDKRKQVLCREGLSGRCYWEAEWSGNYADIGVAYKGINRKGWNEILLGHSDKSWCWSTFNGSYSVRHNNEETRIPAPPSCSGRVGVYLDWPAGTLSFYSVSSDTLTLLHTFHTTFTEPLYPGFWVDSVSSVSLCQLE
ncbi:hypothetical protein MATL_G00022370 [Megalops atlanticus]|uniref:Uncharacterized protein n=1 Tax=Megalops atlanticus TaxID=7932 RepID=A0A9D3TFI8_MEGAT|nr:hypothetical protein MATL_G00022370 [Megalops atlanticus]